MRAALLLLFGFSVALSGQAPGQSHLEEMHAPAGQSDQLPPELKKNAPHLASITVKVVLESGNSPSMTPLVMDTRSDESVCRVANVFKNGSIRLEIPPDTKSGAPNQPNQERAPTRDSCFLLKVMLPGYRSFSGTVRDQQVIVLSRLGEHEGSTVSVTSLSAPEKAMKAYERAESAVSRQKWPDAQKYFEQATGLYPAYAMAWSELGTTMEAQGRMNDAATAYRKAVEADPKYIKPLVQLAGLAGKLQHWEDERQTASIALKLHPVEFPSVYFYLAEANFHLGHYVEAEEAARGVIEIDQHHEFPQVYLLLAAVQAQKGDRDAAVKELREYLKAAPHADDAGKIQEQVARLMKTSISY